VSYDPGFDRCHKCAKVRVGIWQGKAKSRFFTCLRCFGNHVRRLVLAERGTNRLRPRNDL
jgi:hypothetical protein